MIEESQAGRKLRDLKRRLKQENPVLEHVVDRFQDLDRISRRLGIPMNSMSAIGRSYS